MTKEISNSDDVIDSRDIIERIEELEGKETAITDAKDVLAEITESDTERRETIQEQIDELNEISEENKSNEDVEKWMALQLSIEFDADNVTEAREAVESAEEDFDDDEREELKQLRSLAEDGDGYASDWKHGVQLIRESYFEEYAQETAEDLYGKELRDSVWPFSCIDWEQAAEELMQDYTSIEFGNVTYYVR